MIVPIMAPEEGRMKAAIVAIIFWGSGEDPDVEDGVIERRPASERTSVVRLLVDV